MSPCFYRIFAAWTYYRFLRKEFEPVFIYWCMICYQPDDTCMKRIWLNSLSLPSRSAWSCTHAVLQVGFPTSWWFQHSGFNLSLNWSLLYQQTNSGYRSLEPEEGDYPILLQPSHSRGTTLCCTFPSPSTWFAYTYKVQILNLSRVTALPPANLVSAPEQVWTRSCFHSVTNYL